MIMIEVKLEMTKPYIDTRGECDFDERLIMPLEVRLDEETRIRVFSGQLQDAVIENINKQNYMYHVGIYFKFGNRLLVRFPDSSSQIDEAIMVFWQRVQTKLKK